MTRRTPIASRSTCEGKRAHQKKNADHITRTTILETTQLKQHYSKPQSTLTSTLNHNRIRLEPADDVRAAIAAFRFERKRVAAETKAAGASGEAPMDVS